MPYKILLITLLILLFSGCTTTGSTELGSIEKNEINQKIIKNKSTMDDVISIIGSPTSTKIDANNKEIWTYDFSSSRKTLPSYIPLVNEFSRGVTNKSKKLIIYFNEYNIVKNYTFNAKDIQQNSGYLH